jgi:hypothetical protein
MESPNINKAPPPPLTGEPRKKTDLNPPPKFSPRGLFLWFAVFSLMLLAYQYYKGEQQVAAPMAYNPDFVSLVEKGEIPECEVVSEISGNQYIQGTLKTIDPRTDGDG